MNDCVTFEATFKGKNLLPSPASGIGKYQKSFKMYIVKGQIYLKNSAKVTAFNLKIKRQYEKNVFSIAT